MHKDLSACTWQCFVVTYLLLTSGIRYLMKSLASYCIGSVTIFKIQEYDILRGL